MNMIDVDLSNLKEMNKDTVGWIQVNGTNINYPFVQGSNNFYYIDHSFNKSYNGAGWVFLDYRNNEVNDKNNIIYAHSMLDGTMFGTLHNTMKSKWINNKDNHIVKISTDTTSTLWQVFSVYHIPTTNDYMKINFSTDESFLEFIDMISKRSIHNFNVDINADDKIITLSTCYMEDQRTILHAKLIKSQAL